MNAENTGGNTALHYACSSRLLPLVSLLLKSGAAIDALNHNGETPLEYSTSSGRPVDAAVSDLIDTARSSGLFQHLDAKFSISFTGEGGRPITHELRSTAGNEFHLAQLLARAVALFPEELSSLSQHVQSQKDFRMQPGQLRKEVAAEEARLGAAQRELAAKKARLAQASEL